MNLEAQVLQNSSGVAGQCMYCRKPTTGKEGAPHVIPEAICQNTYLLPRGSQCDTCNFYLGKLDSAIADQADVSVCLQAFAWPGKSGKPRMRLGWIERQETPQSDKIKLIDDGIKEFGVVFRFGIPAGIQIEMRRSKGWDALKFHRALYHIALNCVAYYESVEYSLQPKFDNVRQYIRQPRRKQTKPYCFAMDKNKPLGVFVAILDNAPGLSVTIQVYHFVFVVDLLESGALSTWLNALGKDHLNWKLIHDSTITDQGFGMQNF